jgi:hypothetical protein
MRLRVARLGTKHSTYVRAKRATKHFAVHHPVGSDELFGTVQLTHIPTGYSVRPQGCRLFATRTEAIALAKALESSGVRWGFRSAKRMRAASSLEKIARSLLANSEATT